MQPYPKGVTEDLSSIFDAVQFITRQRDQDITEFNNLNNLFIGGRKVGRVPTSSSNVITGDKSGDFNYDANYIYILVGTAWKRASLGSW